MHVYIDRKKKLSITTLLRAIGHQLNKDIPQTFDLVEETKVNKKSMKAIVGRRLAVRVLKSRNGDLVGEDTNKVVSIERNEVVMEHGTEIIIENAQGILDSEASTLLLHKDSELANKFAIIFNMSSKDPSNSGKEAAIYIYR